MILLTGATGYVGGRLLRRLEAAGHRVRCLVRSPQRLEGRVASGTEIVAGDVLGPASLAPAMANVTTAYYLVHSMGSTGSFEEEDRRGARAFAEAARAAGVHRIIYLGGLGSSASGLSAHLKSRQEVGEVLRGGGVPVLEFRASIVIGSGSLSFEMIRALVERLPVMITPRWVSVPAQPIAITDLLEYLVAALDLPGEESRVIPIGGADRVSYGRIMEEYAAQRGLRRKMIPVPVLTPRLSSLWLGLVTPLYARIGKKLVDSLRHPTVVDDDSALRLFPVRPVGVREAIALALRNEEREFAETRWSDAFSSSGITDRYGGAGSTTGSSIRARSDSAWSRRAPSPRSAGSADRPVTTTGIALAAAGLPRSPGRGRRSPARSSPPRSSLGRRCARLVAGRVDHRRSLASSRARR